MSRHTHCLLGVTVLTCILTASPAWSNPEQMPAAGIVPFYQSPPEKNPHPPVTKQDQARVAFATAAIQLFLKKKLVYHIRLPKNPPVSPAPFLNKDLACIRQVKCYEKDLSFLLDVLNIQTIMGTLVEMRHPHVIPWSVQKIDPPADPDAQKTSPSHPTVQKQPEGDNIVAEPTPEMRGPTLLPDEFMVHTYVRFSKIPHWYHLDTIIAQDKKGNLSLRHFYYIPMIAPLPEGVVCYESDRPSAKFSNLVN